MAAVLYVFRTLVDDDIPLNAGCLKPLHVIVPEGCMLNPRPPAAVVAGNVETSQLRHQRALRRARRDGREPVHDEQLHLRQRHAPVLRDHLAAAPAPAPGFDGTSVVQTHMTNSRLTDPEVLEFRFPVRLESYAIRARLGRRRALARRRRRRAPRALPRADDGVASSATAAPCRPSAWPAAQPGALGVNRVERADGRVEPLGHIGSAADAAGRRVRDRDPRRRRLRHRRS